MQVRLRRSVLRDAAALACGALLPLSLAPFELWWLGIASLCGFGLTLEGGRMADGLRRGYLFGLGSYGVGTSWVFVSIHVYGPTPLPLALLMVALFVAVLALFCALKGGALVWLQRHAALPPAVALPLAWSAEEWLRTWLFTGFPWLYVGYGMMPTPLVHYAGVGGVLLVGCLAALTAGVLLQAVLAVLHGSWRRPQVVVAVFAVAVVWLAGAAIGRIEWSRALDVWQVALVQGNVDPAEKFVPGMHEQIIDRYQRLSEPHYRDADLLVWPEGALTVFRHQLPMLFEALQRRAERDDAALVLGLPSYDFERASYHNAALVVGEGEGLYLKRRLVPFGEYIPLSGLLRGTIRFFDLPLQQNLSGPWSQPPLRIHDRSAGMFICYEIVYPGLVRSAGVTPDLLLTISNDTWFGSSLGPLQHLQMARMRAIENARWVVRATNNGVTALIDHRGRVTARLPQFRTGVLTGPVEVREGRTPFAWWGAWPVTVLLVVLVLSGWWLPTAQWCGGRPARGAG